MQPRWHVPALDGLRGLALVAILAYHANPAWLPGAPLSVTVFFVLSGFLITTLLLRAREQDGRVDLRGFWLRRARRLVPASIATVVLVALLVAAGAIEAPGTLIGDGIAALTWSANWRFVAAGSSYESLFADPSPFQHFWTLAVEEQLYVGLPVLAAVLPGRRRPRAWFAAAVVTGIAASTAAVVTLAGDGGIGGRAYYGTDARIAEPLVGILLAILVTRREGVVRLGRAGSVALDAAGWASLGGLVVLLVELSVSDPRLYRGGFLLGALLSAVVVFAATQRTTLARALDAPPLVALGLISYAVYLFHWPVFQWIDPGGTAAAGLVVAELAVTIGLATLSTRLLEDPIRRRRSARAPVFAAGWANASVAAVAVLALVATVPGVQRDDAGGDLGLSAEDPVPPPPIVAAGPVLSTVPGEQARTITTGAAGATEVVPGEPAPAPLSPEEQAILTGDGWAEGRVGTPPSGIDGTELRVAVVGDSLAHNIATGLTTWADGRGDVVIYDLSVSFCPLSRGGERRWEPGASFEVHAACGWWDDPASERASAFAAFAPEVVVHLAPFSEMLDRRLLSWDEWRRPGDGAYHRWLLDEYGAMFDALRGMGTDGTRFLSLNAPCGDWDRPRGWRRVSDPDGRMRAMNDAVYPLMVRSSAGDLFEQLCPEGQYHEDLWGIEDARFDGIHLSDEAAAYLAEHWLGPLVLQVAARDGGRSLLTPPTEPGPGPGP